MSSSAPTVATSPPPCLTVPWPTGLRRHPGYAVVWDLRSPSTPTSADADRPRSPRAGAQPGRPDPLHELAADGVRRGLGRRGSGAAQTSTSWLASTSNPTGPCWHSRTTGRSAPGRASHRRDVHTLRATGTRSSTSGSPPTARWWGRSPPTASSSSGTPPPVGRWIGGKPSIRAASASARTTASSTAAAPTRCCAPGTCPGRTPTSSRRPRSATAEVFAHADLSPDGQRVAYSWLDDQDRDGSGSSTQSPATRRARPGAGGREDRLPWPSGTWHPEGRAVRRILRHRVHDRALPAMGSTPATGDGSRETRHRRRRCIWSLAYVDEGRSLLVGHRQQDEPIVDAETLRPSGRARSTCPRTAAPPRSGTGAPQWSTSLVRRRRRPALASGRCAHRRSSGRGRPGPAAQASVASPDGSTVAVAGRPARSSPSTSRPETSCGDPPVSAPEVVAQLLRRRRASGLGRRGRRGQPVGRHDARPAGHRVPAPPRQGRPVRRPVHR